MFDEGCSRGKCRGLEVVDFSINVLKSLVTSTSPSVSGCLCTSPTLGWADSKNDDYPSWAAQGTVYRDAPSRGKGRCL